MAGMGRVAFLNEVSRGGVAVIDMDEEEMERGVRPCLADGERWPLGGSQVSHWPMVYGILVSVITQLGVFFHLGKRSMWGPIGMVPNLYEIVITKLF